MSDSLIGCFSPPPFLWLLLLLIVTSISDDLSSSRCTLPPEFSPFFPPLPFGHRSCRCASDWADAFCVRLSSYERMAPEKAPSVCVCRCQNKEKINVPIVKCSSLSEKVSILPNHRRAKHLAPVAVLSFSRDASDGPSTTRSVGRISMSSTDFGLINVPAALINPTPSAPNLTVLKCVPNLKRMPTLRAIAMCPKLAMGLMYRRHFVVINRNFFPEKLDLN
ncbi:hypothetical protein niasHT_027508 [Heterodera trifolii]|uniref:Secreted protein n=1 Tax=Heterodera trifolii TaxID=157864 RepID=A0ABD2K566_9BILA